MDTQNFLKILKDSFQIKEFLKNSETHEILIKELSYNDNERILLEYLQLTKDLNLNKPNNKKSIPILCLTLVKQDFNKKNFSGLKKLKLYISEINQKILKVLEN